MKCSLKMFQAAKEGKAAKLFSHLRGFGQIYLTAQDAIPGKRRDRLLASREDTSQPGGDVEPRLDAAQPQLAQVRLRALEASAFERRRDLDDRVRREG